MSNTRSCLTTLTLAALACVVAFHGVVAPFPPDDPRAIVNYFAIPMWRGIPLKWRQTMHIHYTGKELPKEDVESFKGNFFDRSDKRKTVFEMIGDKTNRNVDKLRKSARKSFFSFVKNPLGVERKDRSGRALKFRNPRQPRRYRHHNGARYWKTHIEKTYPRIPNNKISEWVTIIP